MQAGRRALCVWVAAVLAGCTGGQSGTETPSPVDDDGGRRIPGDDGGQVSITHAGPPCACSLAQRNALLRVTLIELASCRVRARVEEVLAVAPQLQLDVQAGAELEAVRDTGCGEPPGLGAGDRALLVYAPAMDDGERSALVATWGSEHVFGMQGERAIVLPQDERERLLTSEACSAWFGEPTAAAEAMLQPACGQ